MVLGLNPGLAFLLWVFGQVTQCLWGPVSSSLKRSTVRVSSDARIVDGTRHSAPDPSEHPPAKVALPTWASTFPPSSENPTQQCEHSGGPFEGFDKDMWVITKSQLRIVSSRKRVTFIIHLSRPVPGGKHLPFLTIFFGGVGIGSSPGD